MSLRTPLEPAEPEGTGFFKFSSVRSCFSRSADGLVGVDGCAGGLGLGWGLRLRLVLCEAGVLFRLSAGLALF